MVNQTNYKKPMKKKLKKIVLHFNKTKLLDLVGDFNLHPVAEYWLDFETAEINRAGAIDPIRMDSPVELDPPLSFSEKKAQQGKGGGIWRATRRTGEASLNHYHGRAGCILPADTMKILASAMDFVNSRKGVKLPIFVCEFEMGKKNKVTLKRVQIDENTHCYEQTPVEGEYFDTWLPRMSMQYATPRFLQSEMDRPTIKRSSLTEEGN